MSYTVDMELIRRVTPPVQSRVKRTPLHQSEWLSKLHGGDVFLKCENLQLTGSFKVRGPFAKLGALRPKPKSVVAASMGNHGLGLAYAARELGVKCKIYVPRTAPRVKRKKIQELGAELEVAPFDSFDQAQEYALERLGNAMWVSPFDDPYIIAGNGGTTGLEIADEAPELDAIIVPVGGGGLAVGIGVVARDRWPRAAVFGVNSEASPGMQISRRDGCAHLQIMSKPTIAEGLEGGVSEDTYQLGKQYIDDVVLVNEETIARAVAEVHWRHGMTIEGSAAVGVAALLEGKVPKDRKRIVIVLTGSNIDPGRIEVILKTNPDPRDLAVMWRTQQHARFPFSCLKLKIDDMTLAKLDSATAMILTACLGTDGVVRELPPSRKKQLEKCEDLLTRALDELRLDEEGLDYFGRLEKITAAVLAAPV